VSLSRNFTQGNLQQTGNTLDIAVKGNGFFQIQMPDGSVAYTRDGALRQAPPFLLNRTRWMMYPSGAPAHSNEFVSGRQLYIKPLLSWSAVNRRKVALSGHRKQRFVFNGQIPMMNVKIPVYVDT
jgi:flagellar basal body rod protein FlgG